MKNILKFLLLCFYAVGVIGGIGYSIYCGAWFIAACIVLLGAMAFPVAKEWFNGLFK